MKNLKFALLALAVMPVSHAATTISGNGSGPAAQGWTTTQTSGNGSQNGFFGGANPNGNGGNTSSVVAGNGWGMYANSGQATTASYSTGDLTGAGGFPAFIQLGLDHGSTIQGNGLPGSGVVGIQFFDGATLAYEFRYVGGNGAARWEYGDSSGFNQTSTVGFSTNGYNFRLNQTGSNTYSFSVNGSQITTGTLAGGAGFVDSVKVFNNNAGSGGNANVVFNTLVFQVPEPAAALLGSLGLLAMLRRRR